MKYQSIRPLLQTIDGLDLRGKVIDERVDLSETRITGTVDLSGATLRRGLSAYRALFEGPFLASRCEIEGDACLAQAEFREAVDLSWARVRGRLYAWRARFWGDANLRQLQIEPTVSPVSSYLYPGEINFSWAWFNSKASFERCKLDGPAYFWRTRFFDHCSFDETSFGRDATFMGKPSEICLSRLELGTDLFDRLQACGLITPDDEETLNLPDGKRVVTFGQLGNVYSHQELSKRMQACGLSDVDEQKLINEYRTHRGPMFAQEASFKWLRICTPRQVKFIGVNASDWGLSGTDVGAIAFFNADQEAVPSAVGLGRFYDQVFIAYGGPDSAIAQRLNRALQSSGVETFFYPENALPGRLIDEEMRFGVNRFDRVLVICSSQSPNRPGWMFELQQALERERQEGEGRVLIVLAVDDALWTQWNPSVEPLRQKLLCRNVADLRGCFDDPAHFNAKLDLLLKALRKRTSTSVTL